MKPYLILVLAVALAPLSYGDDLLINTNWIGISSLSWTNLIYTIPTNSSWFIHYQQNNQPETLKVIAIKYPYYNDPNTTYTFCWTNLVCETKFQPIITKTNDTWYIQFKQPPPPQSDEGK